MSIPKLSSSSSVERPSTLAMELTVVPCTSSDTIVMKKTVLNIIPAFSSPATSG